MIKFCTTSCVLLGLLWGCFGETVFALDKSELPGLQRVTARQLKQEIQEREGKVRLVNFWATWCEPCVKELPYFIDFARSHKGVDLLLVSCDYPEEFPAVRARLRSFGVDFQTYVKDEDDVTFIPAMHPDWRGALPTTLIMDRKGKLTDFSMGEIELEALEKRVLPLLK